ncbi:MAG: TGS domain-containing protein, partial [Clostridia bacterium]|nr:TGS domain-containing protein [Clostridia bacterium]
MLNITLKDGSVISVPADSTALDACKQISEGLARAALACEINGELMSLTTPLKDGDTLNILTFDSEGGRWTLRHSAAHVMAQAVKRLYPNTKFAIGPAIENGFYYDFDSDVTFTPEHLEKIEAEMKKIVKEALPIVRSTLPREDAINFMKEKDEPYKVELIEDLPEDSEISFYTQGEFTDLCAGPHLPDTGRIKAFKLTSAAGAYWRGDEKRPMLTRIYGVAFETQEELDAFLKQQEEAKKRDHRKLGKELDLFCFSDLVGSGLPLFTPRGTILRDLLNDFTQSYRIKNGY